MVFEAFPVDGLSTHQDVKVLHQKVDDLIQKQLSAVTASQTPPAPEFRVVNVMISFTLNIL
jgi:transformation/transcription domain-associated protein